MTRLWALRSAGQDRAITVSLTDEQAAARLAATDREYTLEPLEPEGCEECGTALRDDEGIHCDKCQTEIDEWFERKQAT